MGFRINITLVIPFDFEAQHAGQLQSISCFVSSGRACFQQNTLKRRRCTLATETIVCSRGGSAGKAVGAARLQRTPLAPTAKGLLLAADPNDRFSAACALHLDSV